MPKTSRVFPNSGKIKTPYPPEYVDRDKFVDILVLNTGKLRDEVIYYLSAITRLAQELAVTSIIDLPGIGKLRGHLEERKNFNVKAREFFTKVRTIVDFKPDASFLHNVVRTYREEIGSDSVLYRASLYDSSSS